jgi:ribosomal protein L29
MKASEIKDLSMEEMIRKLDDLKEEYLTYAFSMKPASLKILKR